MELEITITDIAAQQIKDAVLDMEVKSPYLNFYVAGGATSINNNYMNNVANTQRFLLSGQAHTPIGRFSLQYGRDTEIKNGFVQNRLLAIRLMKEF